MTTLYSFFDTGKASTRPNLDLQGVWQFVHASLRSVHIYALRLLTLAAIILVTSLALSNKTFTSSYAATDLQIIDGFNKTVFGAEYAPGGFQSKYIRKFRGTVSFYISNLSKINRTRPTSRFILDLNRKIGGLKTRITRNKNQANFKVYIVDRKDYLSTVRKEIYRGARVNAPGKCFVRSVFTPSGIVKSDAVIVSDEGEKLFKRCLAEEILQGLGPLNEHSSLNESMFNDRSKHINFTRFDRYILNMLYDPRIRVGTSKSSVQPLLPQVLRDVKRKF